jgi:hypothetical protein
MAIEVDEEMRNKILINVMPVIGSAATVAMVAAASAILKKLTATNHKSSTMAGDTDLAPTSQDTTVSNSEVAGSTVEGALNNEAATANSGSIAAADTEANVQATGAEASSVAATAVDAEQGAVKTNAAALNIS